MAMKQFNLEEYLKNPSKKVVTRDGRPVKIYCTNFASDQPIIATMGDEEYSYSFSKDGRFMRGMYKSCHDLFFALEKHEGWVNIYLGPITGVVVYKTEEDAKHGANANAKVIATVKIEWEE